jgi:Zn-dependent protease
MGILLKEEIMKKWIFWSPKLDTPFGFPVIIHWSLFWMTLIGFCLFGLSAIIGTAIVFTIVLLHELGHCYAAHRLGGGVCSILLTPVGGIAGLAMPVDPKKEIVVALAGPLVNVLLIPVFMMFPEYPIFGMINMDLLLFNLIPAFPMDFGRVLRCLLCFWLKNRVKATKIALLVGRIFCGGFIAYGLYTSNYILVMVGVTLIWLGRPEGEKMFSHQSEEEIQVFLDRCRKRLEALEK